MSQSPDSQADNTTNFALLKFSSEISEPVRIPHLNHCQASSFWVVYFHQS